MKICVPFFLLIIFYQTSTAQKIYKPDIQFVTLTDTFLVRQIQVLIKQESEADTIFNGKVGYITMSYSFTQKKDTVFTYRLSTSTMSLDPKENTLGDIYPNYFSLIAGRLVFIYDGTASTYFGFSEKSKKILQKKLEPFLAKKGSKSRTWTNLSRYKMIYYLRDILTDREPSKRTVKDFGY